VQGGAMDGRSDIFCLGTILYEITLGRRLWRGPREVSMRRIVEERAQPPTFVRRDYPTELELIVLRTLEKRPEDRYQSATELHRDLQGFLARSNAHLRSHFHMADYVAKIFSAEADALISDVARKRAQEFVDNAEVGDREELDFDSGQTEGPGAALARALRASALGVWAETSGADEGPHGDPREASSAVRPAGGTAPVAADAKVASGPRDQMVDDAPPAAAATNVLASEHEPARVGAAGAGLVRRVQSSNATDEMEDPPRRWLPLVVAVVVSLAAAGTLWFLQGQ
jgi:hypothetical protein